MHFPDWLIETIEAGIAVEFFVDDDGSLVVNMNTGAKSHLHIVLLDKNNPKPAGTYEVRMRFGVVRDQELYGIKDIVSLVRECLCGRDFVNAAYAGLLDKY